MDVGSLIKWPTRVMALVIEMGWEADAQQTMHINMKIASLTPPSSSTEIE